MSKNTFSLAKPLDIDKLPILPSDFYERHTPVVARELLGKYLISNLPEGRAVCQIAEVEAYLGKNDPASHSFVGKTKRNGAMFAPGGTIYVYLSYGVHFCLNAVTQAEGVGVAVLIRAAIPVAGVDLMMRRRALSDGRGRQVLNGPGKLAQAMGITLALSGKKLEGPELSIVKLPTQVPGDQIVATPRIGISKATDLPLRFYWKEASEWISRAPSRHSRSMG